MYKNDNVKILCCVEANYASWQGWGLIWTKGPSQGLLHLARFKRRHKNKKLQNTFDKCFCCSLVMVLTYWSNPTFRMMGILVQNVYFHTPGISGVLCISPNVTNWLLEARCEEESKHLVNIIFTDIVPNRFDPPHHLPTICVDFNNLRFGLKKKEVSCPSLC